VLLVDRSELLVSKKHMVYGKFILNNSSTSLSSSNLMTSCFFNLGSLDQIGALSSASDKANKGLSFEWGQIFSASDKYFSYSDLGTGLMNVENKVKKKNKTSSSLN
jgi:hypothetical protein